MSTIDELRQCVVDIERIHAKGDAYRKRQREWHDWPDDIDPEVLVDASGRSFAMEAAIAKATALAAIAALESA